MRVFSKLKFFIISLALVLLFGNTGLGAYIVGSKNASVEGNVSINSVGDAVCEIGSTKYTSIEKALAVAYSTNGAQTIRVLPGVNGYTITRPCTLGSGDSLLIPYDDTCTLNNPSEDVEISGFADNNPDTYRKNLVVLSSTLTIEEGASLVICGKVGGANPQGGTTGDYAELQFTSSGYIDCSGDITCYGYIHDQAEKQRAVDDVCIYMHKGIIKEPLAMYDWGSASTAQGKMGNGAFPINHFDFPNIRAPMYFEYGSKLVAMGNVYALKMHIKADGTIVATDSDEAFLQLKNGSGVLINANNVDGLKTSGSVNKHSVSVRANGDLNISAVVVELKVGIINYTLDSKKYYLPISGIYDVTMVSGTCNVNYNTKFLPGSSLTINQGASVEFVKNSVFYNSTTSNNGSKMPDSSTFTKPAMLINNGTLTIDSGFDGVVQTLNSNSKIITKATYTNDSNCFEATENQKIGPFYFGGGTGTILYKQYDKSKPNGYCYVDYSKRDIEAGKTYLGTQIDSRTEYGWYDGSDSYVSYGINFSSSMKEYSNPNNVSTLHFKKNGNEEEVKQLVPNDASKYIFEGYYYDGNFSSKLKYDTTKKVYLIEPLSAINYIDQTGYLTLYAKWIDKAKLVTVQFRKYDANGNLVNGESYPGSIGDSCNISEFTSSFNDTARVEKVLENAKISYDFTKWVVRDASGNEVNLTNNVFTPEEGNTVYYVDPVYSETNWLKYIFKNERNKQWYVTYYSITKFSINGVDKNHKDTNEYTGYVKVDDVIKISTEDGTKYSYTASVSFNDGRVVNVANNSNNFEIKLSLYKDLFDSLNGPIKILGKVS